MAFSSSLKPTEKRYRSLAVYLALVLSLYLLPPSFFSASSAQGDPQPRELERGRSIERELAGGKSHTYTVAMTAGQYLNLSVDQRGIALLVGLYAPDGQMKTEVGTDEAVGSMTLSAIADAAGTYKIVVRSDEKTARAGRYEIKVEELKEATAEERYLVSAESASRQAEKLADGTTEDKRRSIDAYNEALALYRRAGDNAGVLETLNGIGKVYWRIGENQKVLETLNEVLSIVRSAGDRRNEASTLNNIAMIYRLSGDLRKALEIYNEALPIIQAVGDRSGEATVLSNIGKALDTLGYLRKALDLYLKALAIRRAAGDRRGEAHSLNNIGAVYDSMGEMQKSLDNYNDALSISRALGDREVVATTLSNIGALYQSLGEMQKALEKYNEALPIIRMIGDRGGEAVTINNIGGVYRSLGEMQKALDRFSESLQIRREIGDRIGEAVTLTNIGFVYQSTGEMQKALNQYNESASISRAIGDRRYLAATLNNIGKVYDSSGEMKQALENYREALSIRRAIGDRRGEAETLLGIASMEHRNGDLTQALQTIDQAITIVESGRAGIGSQELRTSYFAYYHGFYEAKIDVLMQMHLQKQNATYPAAALAVSERARARSLIELLNESQAEFHQGVDSSLLERKLSLQQRLVARGAAQVKLLSRKHTPGEAEAVAREIASLTSEYEDLEASIRKSSPRFAALTQIKPFELSEIQQRVLDPDTLLLEFSLGERASYLFLSYRLPAAGTSGDRSRHAGGARADDCATAQIRRDRCSTTDSDQGG